MTRHSKLAKLPDFGQREHRSDAPLTPRVHNAARRLGPELVAKLIHDYRSGAPSTQLTQIYGIGKGTVLRLLEANGVPRRNQPLNPRQVAKAIELYQAGWSPARVGKHLGREHTVVRDVLMKAGVPRRDSHGREHQ